jgi:hypothetical protein
MKWAVGAGFTRPSPAISAHFFQRASGLGRGDTERVGWRIYAWTMDYRSVSSGADRPE